MSRLTHLDFLREYSEYVGDPEEMRAIQSVPEDNRDPSLHFYVERIH